MSTELFFWVTISSLLFAMILFFRKSLVQDFVSMSTVIVFYATGTFGNIYNHLFFLPEDALLHDALYLIIVVSIVMGTQVISELLVNMVNGEFHIKVMALNIGEIILSWIGIYIIVYLYLLLWEYSTPIICSLIIPCGIFISALSRVIKVPSKCLCIEKHSSVTFDEGSFDEYKNEFIQIVCPDELSENTGYSNRFQVGNIQ